MRAFIWVPVLGLLGLGCGPDLEGEAAAGVAQQAEMMEPAPPQISSAVNRVDPRWDPNFVPASEHYAYTVCKLGPMPCK